MAALDRVRILHKMLLVSSLYLVGFLVFAYVAWDTVEAVKVNGPQYRLIVQGKDLVADILPPPEYLVESYLAVFEMIDETEPGKLTALIDKSARLRKDYESRHTFWVEQLDPGPMKDQLVVAAHAPAVMFLDIVDRQVIPAVRAGNREAVRVLATRVLKAHYETHRLAIDRLVEQVTAKTAADERAVTQFVKNRTIWLLGLGFVLASIALSCAVVIGNRMSRRIGVLVLALQELRQGHLTAARALLR
jgi:hypothetical protein